MANREKRKVPTRFTEKYGEKFPIWSYSRLTTLDTCTHEYYLARILKKPQKQNIYGLSGGIAHDILEKLYNNEIKYEEMAGIFEREFMAIELGDYKFSTDPDKNRKMRETYKQNVKLFFENHIPMDGKVSNELEVWIDVDGHVFIGYIDNILKDKDGNYIITDYKTSGITEYTGAKKVQKSMQLLLYALALMQIGVPQEKIKCRWNFMKYTKIGIHYKTKAKKDNEKYKETIGERTKWVDKVQKQLRKDMIAFYTNLEEWEIDLMLNECIQNNNLDTIDESISKNYILSDAYVYADVTDETIQALKDYLIGQIELEQSKDKNNEEDWSREEIPDGGNFYCATLCGVRNHCKYWKNYMKRQQEDIQTRVTDEDNVMDELDALMNL